MSLLDKRLGMLEKLQPNLNSGSCIVFVKPGEDASQKQAQEVANFVEKHGHQPSRITVVTFVKPPRRED